MRSVLTQLHDAHQKPIAYFSVTLDPVAATLPGCLKAVAGVNLQQISGIFMGYPVTVLVPHAVEILMTKLKTQHLTAARMTKY